MRASDALPTHISSAAGMRSRTHIKSSHPLTRPPTPRYGSSRQAGQLTFCFPLREEERMARSRYHVVLANSERFGVPGAKRVRDVPDAEEMHLSVYVRSNLKAPSLP